MSSKHYISLPQHFFTQILKRVAVKAINDIPGETEKSSPGGARGHANATGRGGSRKYQINTESRPTLERPAGPASPSRAACRAKGGLSVASDGSPKLSHVSHCSSTQLVLPTSPRPLACCSLTKEDKIKASYMSRSKLYPVSTVFSYSPYMHRTKL